MKLPAIKINGQMIIFGPTDRPILECEFLRKDITATTNLGFLHTPCYLKTSARHATRTIAIRNNTHVIRKDYISRIRVWNWGDKLQHSFFACGENFTGNRVTNYNTGIRRCMFPTFSAVGVIQTHLLCKPIDIYNIGWLYAKTVSKFLIKEFLADFLAFQFLPSSDVNNLTACR